MYKMESVECKVDHFGIRVSNIDKSINFYRDNFNFQEVRKTDKPELQLKLAKLKLGDFCLELLEPYQNSHAPLKKTTENLSQLLQKTQTHIAINTSDIMLTYNKLTENKVEFATYFNLKSKSFFCYDPDKYLIEIKENK